MSTIDVWLALVLGPFVIAMWAAVLAGIAVVVADWWRSR